ncbi:MAG: hypothetical protein R3B72_12755 [Polyangiaceae bacterium]
MPRALPLAAVLVLSLAACGGDPSSSGAGGDGAGAAGGSGPGPGSGGGSTSGSGGGGASGDWETLVQGDWELPPGSESYTCVIATVPEQVFIGAYRPIAPEGTHHTVLTKISSGQDGTFPCDAGTNGQNMIYGSGVGTQEESLPEGVAVRLEAGDKVLLNLHLYNTSTSPITGTSGIQIKRLDPATVQEEAASVLAGPVALNIPPQNTTTQTGYCTIPSDVTLFSIGPHMHQLGTHMTVTAITGSGSDVLHDAPYTFDDQRHYYLEQPIQLKAGDQVKVDCTYNNTTNSTVTFGDSSDAEMCFAGLFLTPATAPFGLVCIN